MPRANASFHTAAGATVGAAIGAFAASLLATVVAAAIGSDVAWGIGLVTVIAGLPTGVIAGALVGARFGRRRAERPRVAPWPEPPAGTWAGHFPLAWVGGVLAALGSWLLLMLVSGLALQALGMFIGILYPAVMRVVALLVTASEVVCAVFIGRAVIRRLDQAIWSARIRAT